MKSNVFEIQFQDEVKVTGPGVDSITEINLTPKVELKEDDYMYTLTGMLLLKGKYKPITKSTPSDLQEGMMQPWLAKSEIQAEQKLDKAFPIRVMIPIDRIEGKEQVQVVIKDISSAIKDENTITLECNIVVEGIQQQKEHKVVDEDYKSVEEDYKSVDENHKSEQENVQFQNEEPVEQQTNDQPNAYNKNAAGYNSVIDNNEFIKQNEEVDKNSSDDWKRDFAVKQRTLPWFNEKETASGLPEQEYKNVQSAYHFRPYSFLEEQEQTATIQVEDQASQLRKKQALQYEQDRKAAEKKAEVAQISQDSVQEHEVSNSTEPAELAKPAEPDETVMEKVEDVNDIEDLESEENNEIVVTPRQVKVKFSKTGKKEIAIDKEAVADKPIADGDELIEEKEEAKTISEWWKAWDSGESFTPIKYYIIQEDDDINRIVETYKITRLELLSANKILEDGEWRTGMRIRIPSA